MSKYIRITGIFIGIWFTASMLNGLICGICLSVLETEMMHNPAAAIFFSIILSFILSTPLVGLVWFITIIAMLSEKKGYPLFQFVLGAAFFCGFAAAIFFIYTLGTEFMKARYVTGLCIIISALASVLFFRKKIKINE